MFPFPELTASTERLEPRSRPGLHAASEQCAPHTTRRILTLVGSTGLITAQASFSVLNPDAPEDAPIPDQTAVITTGDNSPECLTDEAFSQMLSAVISWGAPAIHTTRPLNDGQRQTLDNAGYGSGELGIWRRDAPVRTYTDTALQRRWAERPAADQALLNLSAPAMPEQLAQLHHRFEQLGKVSRFGTLAQASPDLRSDTDVISAYHWAYQQAQEFLYELRTFLLIIRDPGAPHGTLSPDTNAQIMACSAAPYAWTLIGRVQLPARHAPETQAQRTAQEQHLRQYFTLRARALRKLPAPFRAAVFGPWAQALRDVNPEQLPELLRELPAQLTGLAEGP